MTPATACVLNAPSPTSATRLAAIPTRRRNNTALSGGWAKRSASELPGKVVAGGEVNAEPVALKSIREIRAPSPLHFPIRTEARVWLVLQVSDRILPDVKCIWGLRLGVVVVLARVPESGVE